MRRRALKTGLTMGVIFVGLGLALPHVPFVEHYMLTGRFFPIDIVDQLAKPRFVQSWDETGLILESGDRIQVAGFAELPRESAALAEATKRGIEITPDGRLYGLVRVHHWCGNDPVREHIARVDLSHMLTFLHQGRRISPPPLAVLLDRRGVLRVGLAGGAVSEV